MLYPKLSLSAVIATIYVALWVAYYIIVHASNHSNDNHAKNINPSILNLLVETIKLIVSSIVFLAQYGYNQMFTDRKTLLILFRQYSPVAFLYVVYNNLMIINLRFFDPTSYLILSSVRLIMTATIWKTVLKKSISIGKCKALIVITVGIFVKELPPFLQSIHRGQENSMREDTTSYDFGATYYLHLGLVLLQMICSVCASIYNEAILKKNMTGAVNGKSVPVLLQNCCLYIQTIVLNATVLFLSSNPSEENWGNMISNVYSIAIILTLASVGITTAFMLNYIDSVAKAVASSTETAITTVVGSIIFGYDVTMTMAVSVLLVGFGAYFYATADSNPTSSVANTILSYSDIRSASCFLRRCPQKTIIFLVLFEACFVIRSRTQLGASSKYPNNVVHVKQFKTAKAWFEADSMIQSLGATEESNLRNSSWLDENLHRLSRWSFPHKDWETFVGNHIHSHPMVHAVLGSRNGCRVLEIGSGVGAFSRSLLRMYPNVSVVGTDYSTKMVRFSEKVLSAEGLMKFQAHVASMQDATAMRAALKNEKLFDLVFMVGSLCYMPDHLSVRLALAIALENIKVNGLLLASMLPETIKAMRSCETLIEKSLINKLAVPLGYEVMTFSDMAGWGAGNQIDRYSVVLRKIKEVA
jgi:SAM-dependent methyltransferase